MTRNVRVRNKPAAGPTGDADFSKVTTMTIVRKYGRESCDKVAPDFEELEIGERRFLRHWTLTQIRYALDKYNRSHQSEIKLRCESVAGCAATRVAPGIIIRRIK